VVSPVWRAVHPLPLVQATELGLERLRIFLLGVETTRPLGISLPIRPDPQRRVELRPPELGKIVWERSRGGGGRASSEIIQCWDGDGDEADDPV
jgi:hypothetical protein